MAATSVIPRTTVRAVPDHFAERRLAFTPTVVQSSAEIIAGGDDLWLFINQPADHETLLFRIDRQLEVRPLGKLPSVSSGACIAGATLATTATDRDGRPIVAILARDGELESQISVPGPLPMRWPVIGGKDGRTIVWQVEPHSLEIAHVDAGRLSDRRTLPVADFPAGLALTRDAVWAIWAARGGIRGITSNAEVRAFDLDTGYPRDLAIGVHAADPYVSWVSESAVYGAAIHSDALRLGPRERIEPADAAGGTISVVSDGPAPLVWCQRMLDEEPTPVWLSAFCIAGKDPLTLEGLVHASAWWDDSLVVVGTVDIRLFHFTNAEGAG